MKPLWNGGERNKQQQHRNVMKCWNILWWKDDEKSSQDEIQTEHMTSELFAYNTISFNFFSKPNHFEMLKFLCFYFSTSPKGSGKSELWSFKVLKTSEICFLCDFFKTIWARKNGFDGFWTISMRPLHPR